MRKTPSLFSLLLVVLFNSWPASVFAQSHHHPFSSRDFRFNYSPGRKARLPAAKARTLADPFQVDIAFKPAICPDVGGLIIVRVTGGVPPYSYSLSGGDWQYSGIFYAFNDLTHTIDVRDATGAIVSTTALVPTEEGDLTATITQVDASCSATDGSLTINNPSGGTPPYTYSLDLLHWQSGATFSNLAPGSYNVYMKDVKGCLHGMWAVLPVCLGMASAGGGTSCSGNDGGINISPYNYYPPYTFSIDGTNYQSTGVFTGLTPGIKVAYIKDGRGVVFLYGFQMVYSCGLQVQGMTTDASCGAQDGVITASGANGMPPYQYSIDGVHFQSSNVFTGLASGLYTVMITDATAIYQLAYVQVGGACPTVTVYATDAACGGSDGELTAIGGNGTPPYMYSIGGAYGANPQFTDLPAGAYTVTVKDINNLTASATVTVNNSCLHMSATPGDATCGGKNKGTIDITITGGTAPYRYSIDGGASYQPDPHFPDAPAGDHDIKVYDAVGNLSTTTATVQVIPLPTMTFTPTAATCVNNDGSLLISASGGRPPYQYSMGGGSYSASGSFDHLSSGAHGAAVKDASGCIVGQLATIPLNNTLTADGGPDVPICEGRSGLIRAVSNGATFSWQPAADLNDASILQPMASPSTSTTYFLTAAAGECKLTVPVNVIVSPAPVAVVTPVSGICYGLSTQLEGSGGADYSWDPATWLSDPNIPDPVVNKPARSITYHLTVTDAKGCQSLQPASVTVSVAPPPSLFAGNDTSILAGQPLPLYAADINNSGFSNWEWSPAEWLDNAHRQDPVAHPGESVIYTVTATTDEGCEGTTSRAVKVFSVSDIFVPNAFTPNGDGHNDVLKAISVGIKDFRYFAVYDRWGQRVFYTADPTNGWHGDINGQIQSTGTFIWMAGGTNYKGDYVQRKGTVLLIR